MKILYKGSVFNPTGISTVNREMVKALVRQGHQVQVTDPFQDIYDFNKGLEHLNNAINVNDKDVVTVFFDYPMHWRDGYGKIFGGFVHEGTKLHEGWADYINRADFCFVPSKAVKTLLKWNGVYRDIEVIPHGVDLSVYKPQELPKEFTFLSVNSWTGKEGDRKGTDLLIKAFDEEFKDDPSVNLFLKVSTFWAPKYDVREAIKAILGHYNDRIIIDNTCLKEEELVNLYNKSKIFVSPTRGEGFGLTILNAMACGLPIVVTKDNNSGHMDFTKGVDSVLFVDAPKVIQGDSQFYAKGNMLADPDLNSLKKQMREAHTNYEVYKHLADKNVELTKEWTWDKAAEKLVNYIESNKRPALGGDTFVK